jgi:kynurenine formamidase
MKKALMALAGLGLGAACTTTSGTERQSLQAVVERSREQVPVPPWPAGDERGMANTQGRGTWLRCAWHLEDPNAKAYELSQVTSNTMPMSPFGPPLRYVPRPTSGMAGTRHAGNGEDFAAGDPGGQGTQFDAFAHFGYLPEPWNGQGAFPSESVRYYGGLRQADVKPTPTSPLLKLGLDKVPPLITSAVLLDARGHVGKGQALKAGQPLTVQDVEGMLQAQGLGGRGLLPGDVVYIYTGWEERWTEGEGAQAYYTGGPGLSHEVVKYLAGKAIVAIGLDAPFSDAVPEGLLQGKAAPAAGSLPALPFSAHHEALTQAGIHLLENVRLSELAADKVWTSCTMILPLRIQGAVGSGVRPVSIGAPASP